MTRQIDQPRPGFFKLRIVKDGPFVPAAIIHRPPRDPVTNEPLDRSLMWEAWIDGKLTREPSQDQLDAGIFRIWTAGREISADEFRAMSLNESLAPVDSAVNLSDLTPLEP